MSDAPQIQSAPFVTLDLFAAMSGYTVKALHRKIERGDWLQGREYVRAPDGRLLVSVEGFVRWVRGDPHA